MYKDTVFTKYLTDKSAYLVDVYNALEGTAYPLDTPVEENTLTDVLYKDRINDISFTLDGQTIILLEHQSSINSNMALRLLFYISKLYEKEIRKHEDNSIYKKKAIPLLTPKFVVLYNGNEKVPSYQQQRLSDAFIIKDGQINLELVVDVYNINYNENTDLLKKSEALKEYSFFIYLVKEEVRRGKELSEAIKVASEYCIEQGIMDDFLKEHALEVANMLTSEWDWDKALEVERIEGREEGREEASIAMIHKLAERFSPEEIAEFVDKPLSYIQEALQKELVLAEKSANYAQKKIN